MLSFVTPGLSHVRGMEDSPLLNMTIHELFERAEDCCKVFLITPDRNLTYDRVGVFARSLAASLLELGFKQGDRLGVWLPSRWEFVVCLIACSYIGVVLTTMNPAYRASGLLFQTVEYFRFVVSLFINTFQNYITLLS
jgi:acyl-CoA synthetase (AMP-forming)/AMP-acid ligase II